MHRLKNSVKTFMVSRCILISLVMVDLPWRWNLWFWMKGLNNCWMDCHEIKFRHSCSTQDELFTLHNSLSCQREAWCHRGLQTTWLISNEESRVKIFHQEESTSLSGLQNSHVRSDAGKETMPWISFSSKTDICKKRAVQVVWSLRYL